MAESSETVCTDVIETSLTKQDQPLCTSVTGAGLAKQGNQQGFLLGREQ